jgi:nucleoside-diphosphate-sugar epimerase
VTDPVVILGCGYTGSRVAESLSRAGVPVIATSRRPVPGRVAFDALASLQPLDVIPQGARVVYSIPVLEPDPTERILEALGRRPSRVIYLSTTGVYGAAAEVDEHTPAHPNSPEGAARVRAEQAVLSGPWSSVVLRPAAIYGPDRGVHVRVREGTFRLGGDGSNYVSRIHADDLADHVVRALFSDVGGVWPVADEEPATSKEIAEYCASLLNVPLPEAVPVDTLHHTRRANRRVDGSAIRRLLGVRLRYPSYRDGIRAAMRHRNESDAAPR